MCKPLLVLLPLAMSACGQRDQLPPGPILALMGLPAASVEQCQALSVRKESAPCSLYRTERGRAEIAPAAFALDRRVKETWEIVFDSTGNVSLIERFTRTSRDALPALLDSARAAITSRLGSKQRCLLGHRAFDFWHDRGWAVGLYWPSAADTLIVLNVAAGPVSGLEASRIRENCRQGKGGSDGA